MAVGFGSLNTGSTRLPISGQPPMHQGPITAGGSGPNSAPQTPASPSSQQTEGTLAPPAPFNAAAADPAAYGTPGAAASSPLGMWQSWLQSMGPYLAQLPNSQPNAPSGGLSSLAPAPASTTSPQTEPAPTLGTAGYYGVGVGPTFGNRGFQALSLQ